MTYGQLDRAATSIARCISATNGEHAGRVAIFCESRIPAIKAISGAARGGCAYAPLYTSGSTGRPKGTIQTHRNALAFEDAIARYAPQPYAGAAYLLASGQRAAGIDSDGFRAVFAGPIVRLEVGSTHGDALNPRNPVFASSLLRCLDAIRGAAKGRARGGRAPVAQAHVP